MSNLLVIYDSEREVAAVVNTDNYTTLPMAGPGEMFVGLLQSFIDSTPFDLGELSADAQLAAFMSFLDRNGATGPVAPDADTVVAPIDAGNGGSGNGEALAQAEAANAGDVPDVQPADTDMAADTGTTPTEIDCPNCNGQGTIAYGDGAAPEQCRMCKGTRKVTITVPA